MRVGGWRGGWVVHILQHLLRDGVGAVELQHEVAGEDVLHHRHAVLRLRLRQLNGGRALDQQKEKRGGAGLRLWGLDLGLRVRIRG